MADHPNQAAIDAMLAAYDANPELRHHLDRGRLAGVLTALLDGDAAVPVRTSLRTWTIRNLDKILLEVDRATAKFPTWPDDPLHAIAILGEEFGELTKDCLQMTYEPHKATVEGVATEAIQTAAMALRFAMSLGRYRFAPSTQHNQADTP